VECPRESIDIVLVDIVVTLSYEAEEQRESWIIQNIKRDSTLLQIMNTAKNETEFKWVLKSLYRKY